MRGAARLAAVLAASGCASQVGMGGARTLAPGVSEAGMGLEGAVIAANLSPGRETPIPWAQLGASYHRGVADGLELGGRAWGGALRGLSAVGASLDAKVRLWAPEKSPFSAAAAAAVAYHAVTLGGHTWHSSTITVPLLLGVGAGKRAHWVAGPRVARTVWMGESQRTLWLWHVGGSIGVIIPIRSYRLAPELVVLHTPVSFNGTRDDPSRSGATSYVLGLGFGW